MTQIKKQIESIIPYPADYSHREGFSNKSIIDSLITEEKGQVEVALINLLNEHPSDILIVETLAYMKSQKALPILRILLETSKHGFDKLAIATSIFEICQDVAMMDIAITEFKKLENGIGILNESNLMAAFYYLHRFHNDTTNDLIGEYTNHKSYLVSYNAKRFF